MIKWLGFSAIGLPTTSKLSTGFRGRYADMPVQVIDRGILRDNVRKEEIISAPDTDIIYEIPINFEKENLSEKILKKLNLEFNPINLNDWQGLLEKINSVQNSISIGLIGKYFASGDFVLTDAYISVINIIELYAGKEGRGIEAEICAYRGSNGPPERIFGAIYTYQSMLFKHILNNCIFIFYYF